MRRSRQPLGGRHSLIAFAIFATFILISSSASAQSMTVCDNGAAQNCVDRDFSGTQYDPCPPGVLVPFTGRLHTMNNSHTNTSGDVFTNVLVQVQGQGYGQDPVTGATNNTNYVIGNNLKVNAKFSAATFSSGPIIIRQRDKIVSQGSAPPDNWFDTTVVRINSNGQIVQVTEDADCRG